MTERIQLSRVEAAAVFVMLLDNDEAAGLLSQLQPSELQAVGSAMCALGEVASPQIAEAIANFVTEAEQESLPVRGREEQLGSLLDKAIGETKSNSLMQKIVPDAGLRSVEIARWLAPNVLAKLVEEEHPQVVAVLLLMLDPETAAQVLASLPPSLHPPVVERVARLEKVTSDAVEMLDQLLSGRISNRFGASLLVLGGAREAANLINMAGRAVDPNVLPDIESRDSALAKAIEAEMFTFEMLFELDSKDMGRLLRDVDNQDLVTALKGLDNSQSEPFFSAMSSRAADGVRDEIAMLPKLSRAVVDAAKQSIVDQARRLRDEGEISIGADDGDFV